MKRLSIAQIILSLILITSIILFVVFVNLLNGTYIIGVVEGPRQTSDGPIYQAVSIFFAVMLTLSLIPGVFVTSITGAILTSRITNISNCLKITILNIFNIFIPILSFVIAPMTIIAVKRLKFY